MKNQTYTVTKDDRDWLLEMGRQQGVSRLLAADSMSHLVEQFRPPMSDGLTLPWTNANECVRFMPGKVSIWSGPSFAGKTTFLRQLMLHAITENRRVLFISLEEDPDEVWREFSCMASLTRTPNKHQVQWSQDVFTNKLWVFDSTEIIDPTVLMGMIRYGVEKFGFSHIVIDSLMRLNMRTDDYDGQREMGNMLGRVARMSKAHIHLVAHPRKTANSREPMDMYDIRGAQDIVAQADLVLTLERKYQPEGPTNVLTVWKQRGDCNWIGKLELWYDMNSRHLKMDKFDAPVAYLPSDAYSPVVPLRNA